MSAKKDFNHYLKELNDRFTKFDMKNTIISENFLKKSTLISAKEKRTKLKEQLYKWNNESTKNTANNESVSKRQQQLFNEKIYLTNRSSSVILDEYKNISKNVINVENYHTNYDNNFIANDNLNLVKIKNNRNNLNSKYNNNKDTFSTTKVQKYKLPSHYIPKEKKKSPSEILFPDRYTKDVLIDCKAFEQNKNAIARKQFRKNACKDYYLKNSLYLESITERLKKKYSLIKSSSDFNEDYKINLNQDIVLSNKNLSSLRFFDSSKHYSPNKIKYCLINIDGELKDI